MNRVELKNQKTMELFGKTEFKTHDTDPEFSDLTNNFLFGEVCQFGKLDTKTREMITLVVLSTLGTLPELKAHIGVALNIGITPVEVKEIIYACVPYIGLPKTLDALRVTNEVFMDKGIKMPLDKASTTTEDTRYDVGVKLRDEIFGGSALKAKENAPIGQEHIQDYLSGYCFGDWYSRKYLDIKTRELLTMSILVTLGGCEPQLMAHIGANLNVGNDYDTLVNAITGIMPYVGFPRTLNALNCLNKVVEGTK